MPPWEELWLIVVMQLVAIAVDAAWLSAAVDIDVLFPLAPDKMLVVLGSVARPLPVLLLVPAETPL